MYSFINVCHRKISTRKCSWFQSLNKQLQEETISILRRALSQSLYRKQNVMPIQSPLPPPSSFAGPVTSQNVAGLAILSSEKLSLKFRMNISKIDYFIEGSVNAGLQNTEESIKCELGYATSLDLLGNFMKSIYRYLQVSSLF